MKTIAVLGLATTLLNSPFAQARHAESTPKTASQYLAEGWNRGLYFPFVDHLAHVEQVAVQTSDEQVSCNRFYEDIKQKRSINIVLGVGYYDDSEGQPFHFQYRDEATGQLVDADFGMNASIDIAYISMYRAIFTRKCHDKLQVCGFKETSDGVFQKKVKSPDGESVAVRLEMHGGSYSPETPQNVGPLASEQFAKTKATTDWFFGSIPEADLAIYNGHSRKGGGPDFGPPKLFSNLHVNYPWYAKNTPGLNRLMTALEQPSKPKALMLMSCNSTLLFSKKVESAAPNTSFTGTNEVIPGDIPTKGLLAGIDSMMRFQCESGFNQELTSVPETAAHLTHFKFK